MYPLVGVGMKSDDMDMWEQKRLGMDEVMVDKMKD